MKSTISFCVIFSVCFHFSFAQNAIREQDILFKKHLVRSVPLNHIENLKAFGDGETSYISTILLEAFYANKIDGFKNEKFDEKISVHDVKSQLTRIEVDSTVYLVNPEEIKLMEVGEDFIFDKNRSETVLMPTSITFFISPELSSKGLIEPVVSFKYSDCLAIFKNDERAIGQHNNMLNNSVGFKEVFLLHAYKQQIVKIGQPGSDYYDQKYVSADEAFIARKAEEDKIAELIFRLSDPGNSFKK